MLWSNPARGVKEYLTPRQMEELVWQCGDMGDLVVLLGTSGLRYEEGDGVACGGVGFLRRRVRVERNVRVTTEGPVFGVNGARWRSRRGRRKCWRSALGEDGGRVDLMRG